MTRANRWQFPEDGNDLDRIFIAAKADCPQLVFDDDGVFTVSYAKRGEKGSARDFLAKGGPDDK